MNGDDSVILSLSVFVLVWFLKPLFATATQHEHCSNQYKKVNRSLTCDELNAIKRTQKFNPDGDATWNIRVEDS